MAPVLLDNRGLLKAGISIALALVIVFAGGFITGYQKAVVQQLALTQNRGIKLPLVDVDQAEALAMVAPQSPIVEQAGAYIDVDAPDNNEQTVLAEGVKDSQVSLIADALTPEFIRKQSEPSALNAPAPLVLSGEIVVKKVAKPDVLSGSIRHQSKAEITQPEVAESKQSKAIKHTNVGNVLTQVSKLNARYSIQVGMYGQRVNASNLVNILEAQGLDAYISEYLNKKQQLRYNVRFGYFENKRTALKGLKYYTDTMDGKGYLVKLKQTMHAENNRSVSGVPTDKIAKF